MGTVVLELLPVDTAEDLDLSTAAETSNATFFTVV
jgi:hypothetical protein